MGLPIIAEAVARLEHKLDIIIKLMTKDLPAYSHLPHMTPLHFVGQQCPVCQSPVDYRIDITHNVVERKCGCSTGKQPALIPLVPVPGDMNATGVLSGIRDAVKDGNLR